MNNKFYISYETARLLKEKGYDIPTNSVYNLNLYGEKFIKQLYPENWNKYEEPSIISAPTKAEAIDWLESKGIVVEAFYSSHHWFFSIIDFNVKQKIFADEYYLTRLEADEAAIIKACGLLWNSKMYINFH
jgi:hypothetical protein